MVLSGTKTTSSISSLCNQNQGGGDKKAGFPYQVGRIMWTSIALGTYPFSPHCCTLKNLQTLRFTVQPNISRPIGSTLQPTPYWRVTGTGPGTPYLLYNDQ